MKPGRDVLIIDDDQVIIEQLDNMMGDLTEGRIYRARNGMQALDALDTGADPELVFMDICLREENGISLAKEIQRQRPGAEIIFMSGYDDYYLDVYEVEHAWFLRKPITQEVLAKACSRARERSGAGERMFAFSWGSSQYVVPYREILFFEKTRRKVLLYCEGREEPYEFYSTMEELLSMLPNHFIRCHNSYVINLKKVDRYDRSSFEMGGHPVPISRQYQKITRESFYGFLDGEMSRGDESLKEQGRG